MKNARMVNDGYVLTADMKGRIARFARLMVDQGKCDEGVVDDMPLGVEMAGGIFEDDEIQDGKTVFDNHHRAYRVSRMEVFLTRKGESGHAATFQRLDPGTVFINTHVRLVDGEARIAILELKPRLPLESKVELGMPYPVYSALLGKDGMNHLHRALMAHESMLLQDGRVRLNFVYDGRVLPKDVAANLSVLGDRSWYLDREGDLTLRLRRDGAERDVPCLPFGGNGLFLVLDITKNDYIDDELFVNVVRLVDE